MGVLLAVCSVVLSEAREGIGFSGTEVTQLQMVVSQCGGGKITQVLGKRGARVLTSPIARPSSLVFIRSFF